MKLKDHIKELLNPILLTSFTSVIFLCFITNVLAQKTKDVDPRLRALLKKGSVSGALKFKEGNNLKAVNIFTENKQIFGLGDDDQMLNYQTETDELGFIHYRFQQYYKGIPVEFSTVIMSEKNDQAHSLFGEYVKGIQLNTTPLINESRALQLAIAAIGASTYRWEDPDMEQWIKTIKNDPQATYFPVGELVVINKNSGKQSQDIHLAWKFTIHASTPLEILDIYIDANSGDLIHEISQLYFDDVTAIAQTKYSGEKVIKTTDVSLAGLGAFYILKETGRGGGIETFDMNESKNYNLATFFSNANTQWNQVNAQFDEVATDIHWGAEKSYDYFKAFHDRNSFNGAGGKINNYVHFDRRYNNAFFDGTAFSFGDGDGVKFSALGSLDIVAHEFTHGVTRNSAALIYQAESGALSEGFSDIFASCVEFYASTGNWTLGEDITPNRPYLRSMADPKSNGQPDTYQGINWRSTFPTTKANDRGGVHKNCGVLNRWFYLISMGGSGENDWGKKYRVKAIGTYKASKIAYLALTTKLTPTSNFSNARIGTISAAEDLYGTCSKEVIELTNAWFAVGVGDPYLYIDSVHVDKTSCKENNGTAFVRVTGGSMGTPLYQWSNGATTQSIANLAEGSYKVTITDTSSYCMVDTTLKVEKDINFKLSLRAMDVENCGENTGIAIAVDEGVNGTPEYQWNTGGSNFYIDELPAGWYSVSVKDTSTKCQLTDSIEIKEPKPGLRIVGGGAHIFCALDPDMVTVLSAAVSDCAGCKIRWSTGQTDPSILIYSPGTYSVVATDTVGCFNTATTKVVYWLRDCNDEDDEWEIPIEKPKDPNEIIGPSGYGIPRFISKTSSHPYRINFENDPELATAPAIKVKVEVPFREKAEMNSFRLGGFGFGPFTFNVPPNSAAYHTRFDLRDSLGIFVDMTAGIDLPGHKAFWILEAIDPLTGQQPDDPDMGFLPVNDSISGRGEGFVCFSMKAKNSAQTGDSLQADAEIVFDINSPMRTNIWSNTIDALSPISQVISDINVTDSTVFPLVITGSDDPGGSGIARISLYYTWEAGSYHSYGNFYPGDTVLFEGIPGLTYRFFSQATDHAGNAEEIKSNPEASVQLNFSHSPMSGKLTYDNNPSSPLNNVRLLLHDSGGTAVDSSLTGQDGFYHFETGINGDYTLSASTEKEWGGVNATDALIVLHHFACIDTLEGMRRLAGDVNTSNSVNAVDAMLIAHRFVENIQSFAAGDWAFGFDTIHYAGQAVVNDYKGICFGDVDGSYLPPTTKITPGMALYRQGEMLVIPGQEADIPVCITQEAEIGAFSLVLYYPKDLLGIVDIFSERNSNKGNMVFNAKNGELRIAWYSLEPLRLEAGDVLLSIRIRAKDQVNGMCAVFSLGPESCIVNERAESHPGTELKIPIIKIAAPSDNGKLTVRPNPFNESAQIIFGISEKSMAQLEIFDAMGQRVSTVIDEEMGPGKYSLSFDGRPLEPGIYIARLQIKSPFGESVRLCKLILIK